MFDLTISHQPEFNSPTLIYNGAAEGYFSGSLKLVVNEKPRLYAVWMEGEAWFGNLHPRKISISEDNGETWSEAKEIPAVDYFFVEDGKFHALDAVDNAVNFYTSDDDGDTWSTDTISTIAETDTFNGYKAARDDSGNIYLVYGVTHGDGITMILYSMKSTDHGTTWEAIGENSFTNYISQYQLEWIIVNNAGAIQVGYYYNYGRYGTVGSFISTDGGVTFNDDGIGFRMFVNGILEDDGKIYAAYNAMNIPYTYTFHFFKGLNYGSAKLNNIELDGSSTSGDMRMDPYGNLYIAWKSILIRSIDDGDTWTDLAHYTISENAQAPYITLDEDSNIYITWNENNELYFTTVK